MYSFSCTVISGVVAIVSGTQDEGRMPNLVDGAVGWLNSPPLSAKSLRDKVVLANFWTYCCINSAQLGLPVKVVVFELEQRPTGFLDPGTSFKNPNFAAMADALGHDGSALVDAVVNRRNSPSRPKSLSRWPRVSRFTWSRL